MRRRIWDIAVAVSLIGLLAVLAALAHSAWIGTLADRWPSLVAGLGSNVTVFGVAVSQRRRERQTASA